MLFRSPGPAAGCLVGLQGIVEALFGLPRIKSGLIGLLRLGWEADDGRQQRDSSHQKVAPGYQRNQARPWSYVR